MQSLNLRIAPRALYNALLMMWLAGLMAACTRSDQKTTMSADTTEVVESLQETEPEDSEELEAEESEDFANLNTYDGEYMLYTEADMEATLSMRYLGDRNFKFVLHLINFGVCEGTLEDTAFVDQTQHALYASDGCLLHFNLLGDNIEVIQPEGCEAMVGDCTFSGTYGYVLE
jgi:hypothetical protein